MGKSINDQSTPKRFLPPVEAIQSNADLQTYNIKQIIQQQHEEIKFIEIVFMKM